MESGFDDIAAGNNEFVDAFEHGDVPGKPARNMLLITCMDCRIVPHQALGVTFGDMKVIRNGGGQVNPEVEKDVVVANSMVARSLLINQEFVKYWKWHLKTSKIFSLI